MARNHAANVVTTAIAIQKLRDREDFPGSAASSGVVFMSFLARNWFIVQNDHFGDAGPHSRVARLASGFAGIQDVARPGNYPYFVISSNPG
jgi:hypothetical protein